MPLKPGDRLMSDDKRRGKQGNRREEPSRLHRMAARSLSLSLSLSLSSRMIQNINIAPVSLITHGPMSSLRTLHGVHIPRDERRGAPGISKRRGRGGRGLSLRVSLCFSEGWRTHCAVRDLAFSMEKYLPSPSPLSSYYEAT